ncbi:hypothetical protein [Streptomyces sp. NPDC048269]|uniref:hypothetical protein n=1 Tax=Streptomyces sp. NPDC048269 TaxID=3155753 RepID=UPI0034251353
MDLSGLALFLVLACEKDWSAYPGEKAPSGTAGPPTPTKRGLKELVALGFVERREHRTKAPLSPLGVTMAYQ